MTKPFDTNPYASPASASVARVPNRPLQRAAWLRSMLALQVVVILAALAAEAYKHESITFSGPVFAIMGLCIAVMAYRQHDVSAAYFGASAIAFASLIVFLINFNGWSPAQGDRPITLLSLAYSAIAIPLAGGMILHRSDAEG